MEAEELHVRIFPVGVKLRQLKSCGGKRDKVRENLSHNLFFCHFIMCHLKAVVEASSKIRS